MQNIKSTFLLLGVSIAVVNIITPITLKSLQKVFFFLFLCVMVYFVDRRVFQVAFDNKKLSGSKWRMVCLLCTVPSLTYVPITSSVVTSPQGEPYMIIILGACSFGLVLLLTYLQLMAEVLSLCLCPTGRRRRSVLVLCTTCLLCAGGLLYSRLVSTGVVRLSITLNSLPPALHGYTLVQLSDVHVGPTVGWSDVQRVVKQANLLNADLVVLTGDIVDGRFDALKMVAEPLKELKAKDGVYYVTGNHEHLHPPLSTTLQGLQSLKINLLNNRYVSIPLSVAGATGGADSFDLAGVYDYSTTRSRWGSRSSEEVFQANWSFITGRNTSRPLVLLAHQPNHIHQASEHKVDLQLSGHTHGGQIFPMHLGAWLFNAYFAGYYQHVNPKSKHTTHVYVSRGTLWWGPPVRLFSPPEITLITLLSPKRND